MMIHLQVLASGSTGNASILEADGKAILLDIGVGPRRIAKGLAHLGLTWGHVQAAVLTHTHSDHWHAATLKYLGKHDVPLWCHPAHASTLFHAASAFAHLDDAGLVHSYAVGDTLAFGPFACCPFAVPHDDEPTCGFRIEGDGWAVGYAADLGSWDDSIIQQLSDVDVLALEFNHDIQLQKTSGRHPELIRRVLGANGHLSNCQAAELLQAVVAASAPGRVRHVVQLHLSQQCNRPELARAAAAALFHKADPSVALHTALASGLETTLCWEGTEACQSVKVTASGALFPGW